MKVFLTMAARRPTLANSRLSFIPTLRGSKAFGSKVTAAYNQENVAPAGVGGRASSTLGSLKEAVIPPPKAKDAVAEGSLGLNAVDRNRPGGFIHLARIPETRHTLPAAEEKPTKSLAIKKPNLARHVEETPLSSADDILAADSFGKVDIRDYLSPQEIANIPDPDIDDEGTESLVTEYVKDIIVYLTERETKMQLKSNYLQHHKHIVPKHRRILVNWLLQLHIKYKLTPETLYMMCYILDAYVAKKPELRTTNYQLVGGAALWLASKFEEVWPPQVDDIVKLADRSFTANEVLKMEQELLQTLDFNINRPAPITFLRRYSKLADVDTELHSMAKFLLELSVTEYQLVGVRPSKLAAAALYLSFRSAEVSPPVQKVGAAIPSEPSIVDENWTNQLAYYSGYPLEVIMPVVHELCATVKKVQRMHSAQVILDKYSSSKHYRVGSHAFFSSRLVSQWAALAVLVTPEDPKPVSSTDTKRASKAGTSSGHSAGSTRPMATAVRGRTGISKGVLGQRPPFRP